MRSKTRYSRSTKRRGARLRRLAIAFTIMIALLLVASVSLTRPSQFSQMAESLADAGSSPSTQVTASVSISHEYLQRVVDRAFSRAVRHAKSELRSEMRRFVEGRSGLVSVFVNPDVDRLHLPHTVTYEATGNSVRFVVSAEGEFDVPWSRADYGLSLHASIRASPRISARTGTLIPNLSVAVREFRAGGVDRSALLRRGGDFSARLRTTMLTVNVPVSLPGLDSIAESIEGTVQQAARDGMMQAWNGLCGAFPLGSGGSPAWLLARPTGLRFRQVDVTPSATTVQLLLDADVSRVNEHADVECPYPERVAVTDAELLAETPREGRADDLEAAFAVDIGVDALSDIVHVALQESEIWDEMPDWIAERISVKGVRIGFHDRGDDGGLDVAAIEALGAGWSISPTALLMEAEVEARALGGRATGTIYVWAVPVVYEETGEVHLMGFEIDSESRHPLVATFLKVVEAILAASGPYDGEPIELRGDFLPYLDETRVFGLEIDGARLRFIVRGHGDIPVR